CFKSANGERDRIPPGGYGLRERRRIGGDKGVRGGQGTGGDEKLPDLKPLKLNGLATLKKASRGKGNVNVPLIRDICHGPATQQEGCVTIATCTCSRAISAGLCRF